MSPPRDTIHCPRCQHYHVTWDADHPHGCRVLGFKSRGMPAYEVLAASGQRCLQFTPRDGSASREDPPGAAAPPGQRRWRA
ncbi:MAG: hypothetical protein H7831_07155 [Magnetococcus sp. WYHC-3]